MPLSEPMTVYDCTASGDCPVQKFSENAGVCPTCGKKGKVAEKGVTVHIAADGGEN